MTLFNREPVMFLGVVQAAIAVAVSFGLQLSAEQTGSVLLLTAAVLTVVTRQLVTPNDTVQSKLAAAKES